MRRRLQRRAAAEQQHQQRSPTASTSRQPETVRVWLLGGFRVSVGSSRSLGAQEWHLRKAASLIKLLALAKEHRLHREQAMELLWPNLEPEAALNNLHYALHIARRTLEPSASAMGGSDTSRYYLHLRGEWLVLCPEGELWVDVEAFEEAAATAHCSLEPTAYWAAIELYSGELLPQDRYELWVEERREELRGAYLSLLVELAGLYEEWGELGEAIEALQRMVAEEPCQEEAHTGLMRLYALSGRRREALRQYERLREALFKEFGTEPEAEARRLQQQIWAGTFPPADSPPPAGFAPEEARSPAGAAKHNLPRHNLPLARTSFVGREREKLEVKRLLVMTRLLTLTGAGGSGKTRLALEVASDLAGAYPDGVWLVGLAPLSEPELVPQAVASALGVRGQPDRPLLETLSDHLGSKKMLLVMDNCEHLVEAVVGLVDTLLDSCPGLRVLAASRETLNAAGEVTWVVPSLSVPEARQEAYTPHELEGYESVRLLVERARLRDTAFVLTSRNAPAVAEVCRRLDGIPLAIEFAAARIGMLSVGQIAAKLDDSLRLLSAGGRSAVPRHRTLRATLDWSHELLSEPEQKLFGRLSVFAGGFTLEAAEAVGADEGTEGRDVLELLGRLVDKSLVVAEAGAEGALRYRMLEPVRQYALERLVEGGEAEEARRRHAAFFLTLAEEARPMLRAEPQVEWLQRLEKENGNLRGALSWALSADDIQTAARLGWSLYMFWWIRNHQPEGRRWTEPILPRRNELPPWLRIRAIIVFGAMVYGQGDSEVLDRYAGELMELSREVGGDALAEAYAQMSFGLLAMLRGDDFEAAREHLEEALPLFREAGEEGMATQTHIWLGTVLLLEGDHQGARRRFEEGLTLGRSLGDRLSICIALFNLAQLALAGGDYEAASRWFAEGIAPSEELGDRGQVAHILEGLGIVAGARGEAGRAARLLGASEALINAIGLRGHTYYRPDRSFYERVEAGARAKLGEAAFEAALGEGRAMSPEQAIEYALLEKEEREPLTLVPASEQQPPDDERAQRLTCREREVAILVGRGLTNCQIAKELSISEHTVANHVRKILKKLGLRSRVQIKF